MYINFCAAATAAIKYLSICHSLYLSLHAFIQYLMHLANVFTIKTNVSPMTTTAATTTNRSISGNEAKSVTRPHNMT